MSKLRQLSDVDLRLLRVFVVIVDQGSFAGAQGQLNISQSVLSENLKSLEIRLGIRLCERGPGGFRVLPEGQQVYKSAKRLFAAVEEFKTDLSDVGEGLAGDLSLAIEDDVMTNPDCRIPLAIGTFLRDHGRRVRLKIEVMAGFQVLSRVADGSAHVGVTVAVDRTKTRGLDSYALFMETLRLCCGRGHELFSVPTPKIEAEQLLQFQYSSRGHLEPDNFLGALATGYEGDIGLGAQAQLALVLSGRNIGYIPEHVAAPYVTSGEMRYIGQEEQARRTNGVVAVTRTKNQDVKMIDLFVRQLAKSHGIAAKGSPKKTAN
ncbi:LysR family transcriptional regulator [Aminobacter ciceronei]|uniref:DNA-binding transcriptional LysR family regulator n=1 Tax=Aminobacter ciceronei TaxID=150723 RepID=A0ABR6CH07_9HYPH|nr:LysR family transcriptional regulator [Aminobacter ciceronei]MBA8910548.1 DNA-binding transcriptional LysR family regulator [Aminobacter ciceronei]MBA9024319.1 DNA-binding transcriptional LysR family regulator [Aminobacter ciceronei]